MNRRKLKAKIKQLKAEVATQKTFVSFWSLGYVERNMEIVELKEEIIRLKRLLSSGPLDGDK